MYVYCSRLYSKLNHLLKNQKLYHFGSDSRLPFAVITNETICLVYSFIFVELSLALALLSIGNWYGFISIFFNQLKCKWLLWMTNFKFYNYYCKFSSWNRKSFGAYCTELRANVMPSAEQQWMMTMHWIEWRIKSILLNSVLSKHRADSMLTVWWCKDIHITV